MLFVSGEFIDYPLPPKPNLVLAGALDLIADLLAGRPGVRGLLYWGVGAGDPAWDALPSPPAPDRRARTLANEVYRKRLEPGDISYDPAAHVLTIHTVFGPGEATGDLRELGIFGGNASGAPGSGYLINTARHTVIHKTAAQPLDRILKLTLAGDRTLEGLLNTVGGLLGNQAGMGGIRSVAFGAGDPAWDAAPPAFDPKRATLQGEIVRKQVDPVQDLEVIRYQQTVLVHAALDFREAPALLREMGLFGGPPDAPVLLNHQIFPKMDRTAARKLRLDYQFELGIDPAIAVPDVTTHTLADAKSALETAGLHLGPVAEEERADGKNTIVRQKPAAGEKAVDGAAVAVTVAVPSSIPAPRLIGLTTAAAAPVLDAAGLTLVAETQKVESPAPPDTILSQVPASGDLIRPGNSIRVTLATRETTLVPDLTGLRPPEAVVLLRANRLTLAAPPYPTVDANDGWGKIVSQDLPAGSRQVVNTAVKPSLAAPPKVAVPNLVNATLDTAPKTLRDAAADVLKTAGFPAEPPGLSIGRTTHVENAAAPGTILTQDPPAGQNATLFSTVDVNVATPVTVSAPSLTGVTEANATASIRNAGLLPGPVQRRVDPSSPGTVLSQDPPAGSRAALGSIVTITVASVIQVQVPSLVGRSVEFAKEALAGSRLILGAVNRTPTASVTPGTVMQQDQPAGKSVDINSTVNITIAGNTVQLPSLTGQAEAAARKLLGDLGLTLAIGTPLESATVAQGLIAGQSPAANTTVNVGSTVTVNLAIPPKVAVPNLVGKTLQDAQAAATAAKFVLAVSGQAESDLQPGMVAAQSPAAGQTATPGSAIIVQTAVPRGVAVPQLVGLTLAAAQAAAKNLTITVSQRKLSDKAADIVIEQNPTAGVRVAPNSTVTLVTSSGIAVQVPSVLRQRVAAATATLERLGFTVTTDTAPSPLPVGTVINQSPAGGATAAQGSEVSLTIAEVREPPGGGGGSGIGQKILVNPNVIRSENLIR